MVVLRVLGELIFLLLMPLAVVVSMLALPGSLLVLAASVVHSAVTGWQRPSWQVLVALAVLALAAEASDNVLAIWGARRYGASLRSSIIAGIGAGVGAIFAGLIAQIVGIPALVAGPIAWLVVNAVLVVAGACVGAFAAAYWWEIRSGASPEEARRAGLGGAVGRVLAIIARVAITAAMAVIATIGAIAPLLR